MKTIGDFLKSGVIDIAPLLSLSLNQPNSSLYTNTDYQLTSAELAQLSALIQQREQGVPFAYLSGKKGFYHLDFHVGPDTLIPRPETELLIDIALDLFPDKEEPCQVLDLGTGSGIIAVTLADKNPHWQVYATDFSQAAIDIAKKNATRDIVFSKGSWFEAVTKQNFDLIVSNPPYIEEDDPHLKALTHEPISALTSGKDGLDDIRIIINEAPKFLKKNAYLLLEHGYNQQAKIAELLSQDFINIQTFQDYNKKDRAILAQLK